MSTDARSIRTNNERFLCFLFENKKRKVLDERIKNTNLKMMNEREKGVDHLNVSNTYACQRITCLNEREHIHIEHKSGMCTQ